MARPTGDQCYNYKHGGKKTRLYSIWRGMRKRCNNPNAANYKYYGAKGVSVCSSWMEFINFRVWAQSNGYADELTIDRVDSNGNYNPDNCRWVDSVTQCNNRSSNRCFYLEGKRYTIKQLSTKYNINYNTLVNRINRSKWGIEKALTYTR